MHQKAIGLKDLASDLFDEKDWNVVIQSDDDNATLLEKKQFDGYSLPHYRTKVTINLPKHQLVNMIWNANLESTQKDDANVTTFEEIETNADPAFKVRRQINKLPFPCFPRETVFIQFRIEELETTWLVGFSIDHPDYPVNMWRAIRTSLDMSVYRFYSVSQNQTVVQRITNIDPNGLIPKSVIVSQEKKLVSQFNRWHSLT